MLPTFIDRIDSCIVNSYSRRSDRPNNRHWPSEASCVTKCGVVGKCLREQYFERTGVPYDKSVLARVIRIQKVGKAIEQMEIEHAKLAGIHVGDDVEFVYPTGNIVVSGRMDALYLDNDNNIVCVEYKTGEGYWFERDVYGVNDKRYGDRGGNKKGAPKEEHVLQVMCYLQAHDHIPYGLIIYVNRDKLDLTEHRVDLIDGTGYINGAPTELTIGSVVSRWEALTTYLDMGVVPPADFCPVYTNDEVNVRYRNGLISKRLYDDWLNNRAVPGDMKCMYMCNFRNACIDMSSDDLTML